jgi:uncharacterized coiled-coil protein SlyX
MALFLGKDAIRELEARIQALETRLEGLETAPKQLRLEWEDTLDRLARIMGRLNARLKRSITDDQEPTQGESTPPESGPAVDPLVARYRMLRERRNGLLHGRLLPR